MFLRQNKEPLPRIPSKGPGREARVATQFARTVCGPLMPRCRGRTPQTRRLRPSGNGKRLTPLLPRIDRQLAESGQTTLFPVHRAMNPARWLRAIAVLYVNEYEFARVCAYFSASIAAVKHPARKDASERASQRAGNGGRHRHADHNACLLYTSPSPRD